jgi:hypothetical protein
MRISDGSTHEIYGRDIGGSESGDWVYGVPIEEMWNCPWSQTTDSQTTDDRTILTKVVTWVAAFFTGGTDETSATDEMLSISSSSSPGEIPEFTTLAIPVVALLGLFMLYHRKQKK